MMRGWWCPGTGPRRQAASTGVLQQTAAKGLLQTATSSVLHTATTGCSVGQQVILDVFAALCACHGAASTGVVWQYLLDWPSVHASVSAQPVFRQQIFM